MTSKQPKSARVHIIELSPEAVQTRLADPTFASVAPHQKDVLGRISHIARVGPMLEVEGRSANFWSEVAKGSSFGGTALYIKRDGKWDVFTIKPSDAKTIATAEAWIKKRGWKDWA